MRIVSVEGVEVRLWLVRGSVERKAGDCMTRDKERRSRGNNVDPRVDTPLEIIELGALENGSVAL